MELLEEQRETWGTRGGFVLAAVGSAVGLGNLWGFPYKLYSYGGGAFLIPYITAMFCIGIPMLILEFSLGHFTQRAAPNAFAKAGKRLEFVGWWGIIFGFVIITYYPVILAYCFSFLGYSIKGMFGDGNLPWAGKGMEGVANANRFFFEKYLGHHDSFALGEFRMNIFVPLIITWIAMYLCICRGVKLVGKIVWLTVPLPWIMLLILTVRGLTLPGSMNGLVFYLDPVWSELAKPDTWRFAFGQVFFSLSLAFGVMLTYASFLHRKSDINNNAAIIGISDFATSFVAGLAVFATLGAMAYATKMAGAAVPVDEVAKKGASLAFVAFPYALAQLPYSAWFSFVFFFALVTLGIDSGFSITESVLAAIVDKTGWRRSVALPLMSLAGLALGLVYITQGGLNWLGTIDAFINGTWGIAFLGLLECVALGWFYRVDNLRRHANERSDWQLGRWWNYAIRIVIPIVLGTLFMWSLCDDLTNPDGFLKTPGGEWILPNCVGMMVVALAPVIAISMSLIKSPFRSDAPGAQAELKFPSSALARFGAVLAFCFAVISAVVIVKLLIKQVFHSDVASITDYAIFIPLGLGVTAIIISNCIIDKYDNCYDFCSYLGRWAGIIATFDISAIVARILIGLTKNAEVTSASAPIADKLSGASYVILSVVFLLIIGGLGWCFYRAMTAESDKDETIQRTEC